MQNLSGVFSVALGACAKRSIAENSRGYTNSSVSKT